MREQADLTMRREASSLVGCVVVFIALASLRVRDHTHPYYDDVAFLDLGNQVRELGGPLALVRALFSGKWLEDARNPLYFSILSLIAGRDPGYHTRAQMLNVALGVLALITWWWVARRHIGRKPALALAAFMAVSETLIEYSGRESAEPVLITLWALSLGAIFDGVKRPRAWLVAGFMAGIAQLDKGSGIFIMFCFGFSLLCFRGLTAFGDIYAWGSGLMFVVAASPILVRNVRVYGSILHHWNNQMIWIDRLPDFAEIYAPKAFDHLPQGFLQWWQRTTWHEIWFGRCVMGVAETAVHLGDAMSLVAPSPLGLLHRPGVVIGFVLMLVALRLIWRTPSSFPRTFLLVQAAFFMIFFCGFSVAGGSSRYVFPMTLTLVAVLARRAVYRPEWLKRWAAFATVSVAVAVVFDPFPRRLPQKFGEAQSWLARTLKPGEAYAVDSRSQFDPAWLLPASNKMEIVSSTWARKPLEPGDILPYLRSLGVAFVLLDATSQKDGEPRYLFFDRLPLTRDGRLILEALPEGLTEAWVSEDGRLAILSLSRENQDHGEPKGKEPSDARHQQ